MKAIGKITNRMSGDGKFNAVEFSTNEFSGLEKLIEELDKFGTPWEMSEDGVMVFLC